MHPSTYYKPTADFALLLIGPPLSGKTVLAMQFPDPYIISTDHKIGNALKFMPPGKRWWYNYTDTDEAGKVVEFTDRYSRLCDLVVKATADPSPKTIILDNMSDVATDLQAFIVPQGGTGKPLTIGGVKVMDESMWQPFKILMGRLMAKLRTSGKMVIVCCHELAELDAKTGSYVYRPLIEGQMRSRIAGYFTDVWRTQAERVAKSPRWPDGVRYYVRTLPLSDMMLGNSLSLPPDFEFDYEELRKRLSPVL